MELPPFAIEDGSGQSLPRLASIELRHDASTVVFIIEIGQQVACFVDATVFPDRLTRRRAPCPPNAWQSGRCASGVGPSDSNRDNLPWHLCAKTARLQYRRDAG